MDGILVVFGAVIAAAAGVVGPLVVQHREDDRVERREAQKARGAARVMLTGFAGAGAQMRAIELGGKLRSFEAPKRVELPQVVAEQLDGDAWGTVQVALTNVAALARFVRSLIERGESRLTPYQACVVGADRRASEYATQLLDRKLGDGSRDVRRPQYPDCAGRDDRPYGIPIMR